MGGCGSGGDGDGGEVGVMGMDELGVGRGDRDASVVEGKERVFGEGRSIGRQRRVAGVVRGMEGQSPAFRSCRLCRMESGGRGGGGKGK